MHTDLRIDVESIAGGYVVSATGHGAPRGKTHAADTAGVTTLVAGLVAQWDKHNVETDGAETGATIERRGLVA